MPHQVPHLGVGIPGAEGIRISRAPRGPPSYESFLFDIGDVAVDSIRAGPAIDATAVVADLHPTTIDRGHQVQVQLAGHARQHDVALARLPITARNDTHQITALDKRRHRVASRSHGDRRTCTDEFDRLGQVEPDVCRVFVQDPPFAGSQDLASPQKRYRSRNPYDPSPSETDLGSTSGATYRSRRLGLTGLLTVPSALLNLNSNPAG